jgi:hypothetical protein
MPKENSINKKHIQIKGKNKNIRTHIPSRQRIGSINQMFMDGA